MAIKPAPTSKPGIPYPSALQLFTDRVDKRERMRRFFSELCGGEGKSGRPILSFYGVGGVGKTSLLKIAVRELRESDLPLLLVEVGIDDERWKPNSPPSEFFWLLRSKLAGIPTPHFDHLYFNLWRSQHPSERLNIEDKLFKCLLKDFGDIGSIVSALPHAIPGGGILGSVVNLVDRVGAALRDRSRKAGLAKLGIVPERLNLKEMEEHLAPVLYQDLKDWLQSNPEASLCIAIDGFEQIQSTSKAFDLQKYFVDFCGYCTDRNSGFYGSLGFLLLGRKKLRWDEIYDKEWDERIEPHRIEGISGEDADSFFDRATEYHRMSGDTTVPDLLSQHREALLAATCEQRSAETQRSYHPYYLDLAYRMVRNKGTSFQPTDLGDTPDELQIRFVRNLGNEHPGVLGAFQCLALAESFDENLFQYLVDQHFIPGGNLFGLLVGDDYSFIDGVPSAPGSYHFHRLMEKALNEKLKGKRENREQARKCIDAMLDYFTARAAFKCLADCTPEHLEAYRHGMSILFGTYRAFNGSEDMKAFLIHFRKFEEPFPDSRSFTDKRIGWVQRLKVELDKQPNPDYTLPCLSDLARLLWAKGDSAGAEPLFHQALEGRERVLGPDHPDTLTSFHDLARVLLTRGDLAGAEPLFRRALESRERVLGPDHPDTLTSFADLAGLLQLKEDLAGAEPLFHRALGGRERILGSDHPSTLASFIDLARLLQAKGDLAGAELLFRRAFEGFEQVQGPDHPHTLTGLSRLAALLQAKGDLAGAEPLFRRALEALERVLGPDHPQTLIGLSNLAGLLQAKGDLAGEEPLFRGALAGPIKYLQTSNEIARRDDLKSYSDSLGRQPAQP